MTKEIANSRCEELAYELSKHVSKIKEIRDSFEFIADEMKWDESLIYDFDNALVDLAGVMSGATMWALESKFRQKEIDMHRIEADALENCDV